jgi:hypothetical protein
MQFTQLCKHYSPFLAASASLLLCQGQAKAALTYNIFESSGNVVIQTSGNLNLPGAIPQGSPASCPFPGFLMPYYAVICTGPNEVVNYYAISGTTTLSSGGTLYEGSSVSGIPTMLSGGGIFGLPATYVSETPIVSSATFANQTLASVGFTISSGLIGSWILTGTTETIQVFLGPPAPSAPVPGPLPLLGAGAAFGWSRRLRRRITSPLITPPQA